MTPRFATPGLSEALGPFIDAGVLSPDAALLLDVLARRWACRADAPAGADALLALALTLEATQRGHSALDLAEVKALLPPSERRRRAPASAPAAAAEAGAEEGADDLTDAGAALASTLPWPASASGWAATLDGCALVQAGEGAPAPIDGKEAPLRPFCWVEGLDGRRLLSTQRMASEERRIAAALAKLRAPPPAGFFRPSADQVEAAVGKFFTDEPMASGAAALRALAEARFALITGGPGTGKTWSIKRSLAMLLEVDAAASLAAKSSGAEHTPLNVALAAPTGKAAVRMEEAMREDLAQLNARAAVQARLGALKASTVHKLLRLQPNGATRFGPSAPLPYDVLVVDEASMIDLGLMRRLLEAIGPKTRLILLGDRDQLPSVDVGSVLGDLVHDALSPHTPGARDPGDVVSFTKNYRSGEEPALAQLITALQKGEDAAAVAALVGSRGDEKLEHRLRHLGESERGRLREGQADALFSPFIGQGEHSQINIVDPSVAGGARNSGPTDSYFGLLAQLLEAGGAPAVAARALDLLRALDRYRVLTGHRRGPLGVSGLSKTLTGMAQAHLRAALQRRKDQKGEGSKTEVPKLPTSGGLWLGQPVLVTENTYDVNLFNGDIGLVLPDPSNPQRLAVAFPQASQGDAEADGQPKAEGAGVRWVPIARLPAHADAMVLTIHKSQGSQFAHVALILAEGGSSITTRELIYTGITRAQQRVSWLGSAADLRAALDRRVKRGSGLVPRLRASADGTTDTKRDTSIPKTASPSLAVAAVLPVEAPVRAEVALQWSAPAAVGAGKAPLMVEAPTVDAPAVEAPRAPTVEAPRAPALEAPAQASMARHLDPRQDLPEDQERVLRQLERLLVDRESVARAMLAAALGVGLDDPGLNDAIQSLVARGLVSRGPGAGGTLRRGEPLDEAELRATLDALEVLGGKASSQKINAWAEGPGGVGRVAVTRCLECLAAMGWVERAGWGWALIGN